jgi:spore cortex formation protein SpoVR/YcgB (stage V sporulation)
VRSVFLETSLHLEKATSLLPKIRKHGSGQVQTIIAHVDSIKQFFNNNHSVSTLREIGDSILDKKERLLSYSTNKEFKGEIKDLYDAFHKTKTELTI